MLWWRQRKKDKLSKPIQINVVHLLLNTFSTVKIIGLIAQWSQKQEPCTEKIQLFENTFSAIFSSAMRNTVCYVKSFLKLAE